MSRRAYLVTTLLALANPLACATTDASHIAPTATPEPVAPTATPEPGVRVARPPDGIVASDRLDLLFAEPHDERSRPATLDLLACCADKPEAPECAIEIGGAARNNTYYWRYVAAEKAAEAPSLVRARVGEAALLGGRLAGYMLDRAQDPGAPAHLVLVSPDNQTAYELGPIDVDGAITDVVLSSDFNDLWVELATSAPRCGASTLVMRRYRVPTGAKWRVARDYVNAEAANIKARCEAAATRPRDAERAIQPEISRVYQAFDRPAELTPEGRAAGATCYRVFGEANRGDVALDRFERANRIVPGTVDRERLLTLRHLYGTVSGEPGHRGADATPAERAALKEADIDGASAATLSERHGTTDWSLIQVAADEERGTLVLVGCQPGRASRDDVGRPIVCHAQTVVRTQSEFPGESVGAWVRAFTTEADGSARVDLTTHTSLMYHDELHGVVTTYSGGESQVDTTSIRTFEPAGLRGSDRVTRSDSLPGDE